MDHKLAILSLVCTIILTTDGACPNGWTRYNDSCFRFKDTGLSWHDAKNACIDMHAHLAIIETPAVNNFLMQALRERHLHDANHYWYWIDGNDMSVEGEWLWDNGDKPTFYDWAPGQPNDYHHDEDCLGLYALVFFHWNDAPCTSEEPYICEMEDPLNGAHQPVVG